jgi:hypothetical protein
MKQVRHCVRHRAEGEEDLANAGKRCAVASCPVLVRYRSGAGLFPCLPLAPHTFLACVRLRTTAMPVESQAEEHGDGL